MIGSVLVLSIFGAVVYNGIGYFFATDRKNEGYSILKAGRTLGAGFIQAGICIATCAILPDCVAVAMPETILNGIMVGGFGSFGIDKALKFVGIK